MRRPWHLRVQSDERLVMLVRRGNLAAFDALAGRYQPRLLSFCRHMLRSREDAEDVVQDAFAAAFVAMIADDRPIKVEPWFYRIVRNRSLNHLRRAKAAGMDSMDHHADQGPTTAEKAHGREEFRLLVQSIKDLPDAQRGALVLREMNDLSYEQIAAAMNKSIPSVKSLLVRARATLAEAEQASALTCAEVGVEIDEIAEGRRREASPHVRRHVRACERCSRALGETRNRLAGILPLGTLAALARAVFGHLRSTAGVGGGVPATGAAASTLAGGSSTGALVSTGAGAIVTKATVVLSVAALGVASAVAVDDAGGSRRSHFTTTSAPAFASSAATDATLRLHASETQPVPQRALAAARARTATDPTATTSQSGPSSAPPTRSTTPAQTAPAPTTTTSASATTTTTTATTPTATAAAADAPPAGANTGGGSTTPPTTSTADTAPPTDPTPSTTETADSQTTGG